MVKIPAHATASLQFVKCGNYGCACRSEKDGGKEHRHGPYWYASWYDSKLGKNKTAYIGKEIPKGLKLGVSQMVKAVAGGKREKLYEVDRGALSGGVEKHTVEEWSEISGVPVKTIRRRLHERSKNGYSIERCIFAPKEMNKPVPHNIAYRRTFYYRTEWHYRRRAFYSQYCAEWWQAKSRHARALVNEKWGKIWRELNLEFDRNEAMKRESGKGKSGTIEKRLTRKGKKDFYFDDVEEFVPTKEEFLPDGSVNVPYRR